MTVPTPTAPPTIQLHAQVWTLERLTQDLRARDLDAPALVLELKQLTGLHSNDSLFRQLEPIMGCRREAMHRWLSSGVTKRKPSSQTLQQLRLLALLLRNAPLDHFVIDGQVIPRR